MKLEPNYLPETSLIYASFYDVIVGPKAKVTFSILITSNRIKLSIYSYEKVIFSFLVKTIHFLEFWSKIRILIKTAELVQQGVYLTPAGLRKKLIRYRQYTHGYVRN